MSPWVIVLASVGACFLLIMWFVRYLENRVNKVDATQHHTHERISSLEVKDYNQDARLDAHRKALIHIKKDIRELGKDVGWDESRRQTQVIDGNTLSQLIEKTKKPGD